jgi:hypothetical protein
MGMQPWPSPRAGSASRQQNLRVIARRILDQQTLDGIAELIAELEAEEAALHPK